MGLKQMRMNVWARYVNVFVLMFLFAGTPVPGHREGLIACSIFTLVANVALHLLVLRTGNYRMISYLLLGVDLLTVIPAIYFTGMVASPFIVVVPLTLFSTFFINRDARVTVGFGVVSILEYVLLYAIWRHGGGEVTGWNLRVYPGYTMFVFLLQAVALGVVTYQSGFLPNPLMVELQKQEAVLARQAKTAELGVSLAMVVHELRNPLTSIGAGLEIAQSSLTKAGSGASPVVVRSVERAMEEMQRVSRMLENLLAYSRDRRGTARREPVNLREVVDRAVEFINLKHGKLRMACTITATHPQYWVAGDRDTLYQVLVNLIDNAVTAEVVGRRLEVGIDLTSSTAMHEIVVRDNGCGMSAEMTAHVFDAFVSSRHTGTGLGLPIVKGIIKDHEGSIVVASVAGIGTSFTIHLPALEHVPALAETVKGAAGIVGRG